MVKENKAQEVGEEWLSWELEFQREWLGEGNN